MPALLTRSIPLLLQVLSGVPPATGTPPAAPTGTAAPANPPGAGTAAGQPGAAPTARGTQGGAPAASPSALPSGASPAGSNGGVAGAAPALSAVAPAGSVGGGIPGIGGPAPPAIPPAGRRLGLDEATAAALAHQPQLAQSRAQTMVARGRVEQSSAGLYPQVAGTATYQRQSGNFAPRPGSTPAAASGSTWNWTTYNYFNFGLTGSQLIYDFGQTADRSRSAEASLDATRAQQRTTEVSVVLAVRRAFFAAKAQRSLAQVAADTLANQERHLTQIKGFVLAGTRPEIDLSQAKSDVATARVQLIVAQNNYEVARAQLDQAMGVPTGGDYDVADDEMNPVAEEDQSSEPLTQRALAARPEFAAYESQRRAAEYTIKSIRAYQYAPTLAAIASLSDSGTSLNGLVPNWSVGAQLTWPILVGGLAQGQITEAEGNLAIVQAQVDATRLQVRFDVEQARVGVKGARATIGASEEALLNARERLRLAEGRYQAGVGNIIELGDAQLAVASAASQLVQAQYNLATARAQLLAALGRR